MLLLKKINCFFITLLFLIIRIKSFLIRRKCRNCLGKLIGRLGFYFWNNRKKIAIDNLQKAFPEKNIKEIKKIARGSFESVCITFMELFILDLLSVKSLNKMLVWNNELKIVKDVVNQGRGCIFLSGHIGNWELIAYSVRKQTNFPITIIVKPQANYIADNFLNKIRTSNGNKIVSMYNAAKTILKAIHNNEIIALLTDQAATEDKDLYIDFFGRKTATFKVVAELALRNHIPIIMGFAIRMTDGTYKTSIQEVDFEDLYLDGKLTQENVRILTERHTKILENTIRQYPDQWAWMHKRWKHIKK